MDTTRFFSDGERALMHREGQRVTDIALGRADNRTQVCHYLAIERLDHPFGDVREFEQHRDIERVYANAHDCETGNRHAKCLGAFTATYRDGKLTAVEIIDLSQAPAIEVPSRAARRNFLVRADR